jgi:very-short-patch-repair endonuclease
MDWQERSRQEYQQRQAEKARLKQLADEQARIQLKAQFEEQQRHAIEQDALRIRQSEEQRRKEMEQQTAAMQRIKKGLEHINQEAQARLDEVRAIAKQLKMQAPQEVWIGWDGKKFRSPREQAFWDEWKACGYWDKIPLISQLHLSRYWADFADPESMSVIEIDGRTHHTDRVSFTRDRVKDRTLKKLGWDVIRFSADEVKDSIETVVNAAYEFIQEQRKKVGKNDVQ